MGEYTRVETLSALADNESSELEYRRVLREMDDEDAAAWSRWHLASDLMQGRDSVAVPEDFAAGVRGNLGRQNRRPAWFAGAARVVVAASVAAATVVGWQFWDTAAPEGAGQPVAGTMERAVRFNSPASEAALVTERAGDTGGARERARPAAVDEQHLNQLMVRHNDLSARQGRTGVTANARLVSLEARDER